MSGFNNYSGLINALSNGQSTLFSFRKAPIQTTATNIWFDLSMSPGNPVPNYYAAAPLSATALTQSGDGGLFHGANVGTTQSKHLFNFQAMVTTPTTAVPLPIIIQDYLLYYPFCDMSSIDVQAANNTNTLPRYANGNGVQIMAVEVASQSTGGAIFTVNYTNSAGVAGRVTPSIKCNTQTSIGTIITSAAATASCVGPYLPLQAGDSGVQSIQSVTFDGTDVGLVTLVLVKPLATLYINDITAPTEKNFATGYLGLLPKIYNDAYINMICLPSGTISGANIFGLIETVWN